MTDYKAKYEEAMRALEHLTPGGSEYVDDVRRCVLYITEARHMQHEQIIKFAKRAKRAEAALRTIKGIVEANERGE